MFLQQKNVDQVLSLLDLANTLNKLKQLLYYNNLKKSKIEWFK